MNPYERQRIELELKSFTSKNFEKPSECRNLEQIRFYVKELASRIESLETTCNYAPDWAYSLLAQYNAKQNALLLKDFKKAYH